MCAHHLNSFQNFQIRLTARHSPGHIIKLVMCVMFESTCFQCYVFLQDSDSPYFKPPAFQGLIVNPFHTHAWQHGGTSHPPIPFWGLLTHIAVEACRGAASVDYYSPTSESGSNGISCPPSWHSMVQMTQHIGSSNLQRQVQDQSRLLPPRTGGVTRYQIETFGVTNCFLFCSWDSTMNRCPLQQSINEPFVCFQNDQDIQKKSQVTTIPTHSLSLSLTHHPLLLSY